MDEAAKSRSEPTKPTALLEPRTFQAVLGHAATVDALCERVRGGATDGNVLLHGPSGAGKRTLARLYAKALLCEGASSGDLPCSSCSTCRHFDGGALLNYVCVSSGRDLTREGVQVLVKGVASGFDLGRRVIVIHGAEDCPIPVFDALLKTMEEPATPTVFVLTAGDVKKVRAAGQSRCSMYRLRPVPDTTARDHVVDLCSASNLFLDDRAVDVLVAAAGGWPGRLNRLWAEVITTGAFTFEAVRGQLGLDWVGAMEAGWRDLLKAALSQASDKGRTVGMATARLYPGRVRAFLLNLHQHMVIDALGGVAGDPAQAVDPAFVHWPDTGAKLIVEELKARAAELGTSAEMLWCELARLWLRDDVDDPEGQADIEAAIWKRICQAPSSLG